MAKEAVAMVTVASTTRASAKQMSTRQHACLCSQTHLHRTLAHVPRDANRRSHRQRRWPTDRERCHLLDGLARLKVHLRDNIAQSEASRLRQAEAASVVQGHARGVADTAWQEGMLRWISSSPIGLHGLGDVGKSRRAPTSTRPLSPFSSYSSGHLKTATCQHVGAQSARMSGSESS